MVKPTGRRWTLLLTVVVTLIISVPAAVWASHQFTDVPDSHVFHTGISWMKDHNITVGCNPPANTRYCPDDFVTRGQMATFMKRLAENQVVDAATATNADHAATATNADHADTATNADTVDGLDSSDIIGMMVGRGYGQVRVTGIIPSTSFWNMEFVGPHPGFLSARTPAGGVTCIKPDPSVLSTTDVTGGQLTDASGNDTRAYFNGSFGCDPDEVRVVQRFNIDDSLTNQPFNIFAP